jgi:hypothetical protein
VGNIGLFADIRGAKSRLNTRLVQISPPGATGMREGGNAPVVPAAAILPAASSGAVWGKRIMRRTSANRKK